MCAHSRVTSQTSSYSWTVARCAMDCELELHSASCSVFHDTAYCCFFQLLFNWPFLEITLGRAPIGLS